jgi:hypothetical protein
MAQHCWGKDVVGRGKVIDHSIDMRWQRGRRNGRPRGEDGGRCVTISACFEYAGKRSLTCRSTGTPESPSLTSRTVRSLPCWPSSCMTGCDQHGVETTRIAWMVGECGRWPGDVVVVQPMSRWWNGRRCGRNGVEMDVALGLNDRRTDGEGGRVVATLRPHRR